MRPRNTSFDALSGRLTLEGYPNGFTVHGIEGGASTEIARLALFHLDLRRVTDWLQACAKQDVPGEVKDGLSIAAVIKFCECFEGTGGLRRKPLNLKRIFLPSDRKAFESLREIRNKIAAHDDQIYPMISTLIVLDEQADVFEHLVCMGRFSIADIPAFSELRRLVPVAMNWVERQFDEACLHAKTEAQKIDYEERVQAKTQGFTIDIKARE